MIYMPSRQADNTLVFKIVFWGPSLGGKTTALEYIYNKEGLATGKLQSISDPTGRTLFFDRVVARVSNVIFQCYTVAGQRRHKYQRKTVLKGADALLFFWDSTPDQWQENIYSLKELLQFFGSKLVPDEHGQSEVPLVLCANKRDVENATEIRKIKEVLNAAKLTNVMIYETLAITGENIKKAFVYAAREAVLKYYMKLQQGGAEAPKEEQASE